MKNDIFISTLTTYFSAFYIFNFSFQTQNMSVLMPQLNNAYEWL